MASVSLQSRTGEQEQNQDQTFHDTSTSFREHTKTSKQGNNRHSEQRDFERYTIIWALVARGIYYEKPSRLISWEDIALERFDMATG